jgi:hypothetical protein
VKPLDCLMQWLCSSEPLLSNLYSHAVVNVGGFETFDILFLHIITPLSSHKLNCFDSQHIFMKMFQKHQALTSGEAGNWYYPPYLSP